MPVPASRPRIGNWEIERTLGRGGTSVVYAATSLVDGSRAAIKVLHRAFCADRGVVRIFLSEARLVGAIGHPGIVRVLEEGMTEDGSAFLALELLSGQTLEQLRQERGGRIPLDEVMRIGHALMDAIAAVHAAGVIHRDLKPQNIFVLEGGGVKVLDFGVAKLHGATADAAQHLVGTPSFMPPEQALGLNQKIDARSDVWSLGATLFHVLSGQPVHIARHMNAMMLASASVRPRSLADAAPELSSAVVAVVDRALAYRKAERWPSIAEMRTAWLGAHPAWLPTLPPPSFTADPSPAPTPAPAALGTRGPAALFDPRELLREDSAGAPPRRRPPGVPPPLPRKARRGVSRVLACGIAVLVLATAATIVAHQTRARLGARIQAGVSGRARAPVVDTRP